MHADACQLCMQGTRVDDFRVTEGIITTTCCVFTTFTEPGSTTHAYARALLLGNTQVMAVKAADKVLLEPDLAQRVSAAASQITGVPIWCEAPRSDSDTDTGGSSDDSNSCGDAAAVTETYRLFNCMLEILGLRSISVHTS